MGELSLSSLAAKLADELFNDGVGDVSV